MIAGVSKSGSPAPNPTTSIPFCFISRALAVIARVGDGFTTSSRFASFMVTVSSGRGAWAALRDGQRAQDSRTEMGIAPSNAGAGGPSGAARGAELAPEPFRHVRRDEARHVPAEGRHLAHQPRRDEEVVLAGHDEDRLELGQELAVHVGELELVLEVGDGPQAAQHGVDALRRGRSRRAARRRSPPRRVGSSPTASGMSALRSSTVNSGDFCGLLATATMSRSNSFRPRWMMARWPLVSGIEGAGVDGGPGHGGRGVSLTP